MPAENDRNNRSKQLHFHNVQIDSLGPYAQHEVHGLLGQRAISPVPLLVPTELPPVGGVETAASELSKAAATSALSVTASLGGATDGISAGTTIRAAVQADGEQHAHWVQGEGAIVGTYVDYKARAPAPWLCMRLFHQQAEANSPSLTRTGTVDLVAWPQRFRPLALPGMPSRPKVRRHRRLP